MRSLDKEIGSFDVVLSAVLMTLGVLGLLAQTNLLEIHLHLPAGWKMTQWWPLGLVALGAGRLALSRIFPEQPRQTQTKRRSDDESF